MIRPQVILLLSATLLSACGTKTNLHVPSCLDGGIRECETECGLGVSLCVDGVYAACEVPPAERPCTTACGEGVETCVDEVWSSCSSQPLPPLLAVRVRDFRDTHPDFEAELGDDRGIVRAVLGPDEKPVYAGPTPTTHGREAFDQWYRDVPGINEGTPLDLPLRPDPDDPALFVYDDRDFFPIDDMLFGNEGRPHNFHFTLEAVTEFAYLGGEVFRFRGDDDVFVFINRRLAINLGGVHNTQEDTIALDVAASDLGMVLGGRYPIHFFFAERHTTGSKFRLETTIIDPLRCR